MATKKQKHEAAVARREKFMAEVRRTGLEAQRKDRERREAQMRKATEKAHEKHYKFVDDCLHCKAARNKESMQLVVEAREIESQMFHEAFDVVSA